MSTSETAPMGASSAYINASSATYASREEMEKVADIVGSLIAAGELLGRENARQNRTQARHAALLTKLHIWLAVLSCLVAVLAVLLLVEVTT